MAKIRETMRAHENALERLASRIPGFRGYRERESRREADKVLRDFGATRLERVVRDLHEVAAKAALDELDELQELSQQVEKLRAELRFADRGYSGFFDEVKLDSLPALDAVYAQDERVVEQVEELATHVHAGDLDVAATRAVVKRLGLALADRRNAILGIGAR